MGSGTSIATWATLAGVLVSALIAWLAVRATRRATVDAKAASDLAARDRLLEARDRDVESRDRAIESRDRWIDQLQEERNRTGEQMTGKDSQLHEALERIDLQIGQIRSLEEQLETERRRGRT